MQIKYIDRESGQIHMETPPAEGLLKFLYDNPLGRSALLPIAKRKFISALYGRRMDTPKSVARIAPFVEQLNIDMSESEKEIKEFSSFNDFFYRKLKPGTRPLGQGFVSPGDGKLLAFESAESLGGFFVKGEQFTLARFLGDEELAERFAQHALLILRLAPNDYHRYHFPHAGRPTESHKIAGHYYSVSPYALSKNFVRVFCENKREYCILRSQEAGDTLLAPVGATMVGSIHSTYEAGHLVTKGDEMGYFAFGGSTIVLLVDGQRVRIHQDLLSNTAQKIETFVKMGSSIGDIIT